MIQHNKREKNRMVLRCVHGQFLWLNTLEKILMNPLGTNRAQSPNLKLAWENNWWFFFYAPKTAEEIIVTCE